MQIAVLGAGSTALANAWFLARAGHGVRIWSVLEAERRALASIGRLSAHGIVNGTVSVTVAPSTKACLDGASLVIIAAPAFAHEPLMAAAAAHLTAQQDVMVHPVTGLSSLLLSRMLKSRQANNYRRLDQPVHRAQG
jgi:opine dehydrogenase